MSKNVVDKTAAEQVSKSHRKHNGAVAPKISKQSRPSAMSQMKREVVKSAYKGPTLGR